MKIGFYDPYFDTLGGGERYTLTLASHWSKKYDVRLFWNEQKVLKEASKRFDLDLSRVTLTENVFATNKLFYKLSASRQYDLIFFLSDGSIPTSFAKHNILHFQVPFPQVSANPIKLSRYQAVVCNSIFTKMNLDPKIAAKASVIYPPVKLIPANNKIKKEKCILTVGRFTSFHHAKKQEDMIKAFISAESKFPDWNLILAGGLMLSDQTYFESLVKLTKGHRVKLMTNISYAQLVELYQKSSIYWHATGLNETDPKLMEHFGISTVEAMSAGAIPVVWDAGGQREIVIEGKNGYLWHSTNELISKTLNLIKSRSTAKLLHQGIKDSHKFSENVFFESYDKLLSSIFKIPKNHS